MKLLRRITDNEILGQEGLSNAKPRLTARAILRHNGQLAVMYAGKFDLYSLPGGGVEEGETILAALNREIMEETGCNCDSIQELGYVEENRAHCDYTQISYYYIVDTACDSLHPVLTETEVNNQTAVAWHSLDEAYRLIAAPVHTNPQRKYLQARDLAALDAYWQTFKSGEEKIRL